MSFLRMEKTGKKNGQKVIAICDICKKECIKPNNSYQRNSEYHFCSMKCRAEANKKGNILDKKTVETNRKKYGVDYAQKLEITKEKIIKTNMERYGVPVSSQNKEVKQKEFKTNYERYGCKSSAMNKLVKEKAAKTCIEKYGYVSPIMNEEINKKSQKTCLKNHGVPYGTMSEESKIKSKDTCKEKYGVEHASQNEKIKEKIKSTLIKNYGVDNPLKSKEIRKKCIDTLMERYGVTNPSQSAEIRSKIDYNKLSKKAHETMKKNGNYGKSKVEDRFYEWLCTVFEKENIERQVTLDKFLIDFYVKTIDLYIQFDGVYWHGLNRKIEEIEKFKNPRDKVIYETIRRDKEQNEFFIQSDKKLARVMDKEFTTAAKNSSFGTIIEKLK